MFDLELIDDGEQMKMPVWMRFYFNLGVFISENLGHDKIITAAVSVPTRSFAAVTTAASLIVSRLKFPPLAFVLEQINRFRQLPIGTSVIHRRDGKNKKAHFNGICNKEGKEYINIRTEKGTEVFVPIFEVARLRIVEDREFRLPKTQKGTKCSSASPLIKKVIPKDNLADFLDKTRFNCLIVGRKIRLQKDAERKCLLVDGKYVGSFDELLRPQNLQKENAAFRSTFISQSTRNFHFSDNHKPEVVIIDNPLSYLRWRKEIRELNKIIFFDKTDRNYFEGVEEINHYYATVNREIINIVGFPLPHAVELMIFNERIN